MTGFFSAVKGIVITSAKASKTALVYSYNTARESMLPIYIYISAADLNSLCKEAYKSGLLSARTKQKLMYVLLNLTTSLGLLSCTEN